MPKRRIDMTAWTLFVQFLADYLAYFVIVAVLVAGLIAAGEVIKDLAINGGGRTD